MHVVGACHKCRINFKWSNDTTTDEGVHKDSLVGEIRRYNKQKSCDLGENAEYLKVIQRPLLVTRKATAPSAVMRCRQEKRSKRTGLYKRGGRGRGSCDMELLSHDFVTIRDEMENDQYSRTT